MRLTTPILTLVLCAAAASPAPAQTTPRDDIWLTTWNGARIDRFGLQAGAFVPLPNAELYRRAPNGDVWFALAPFLRQFGKTDSEGRGTLLLAASGDVLDLAVDARGHAFLSIGLFGGQALVEERDPQGLPAGSFPLPGRGRALVVDETQRLWVGIENSLAAVIGWRDPGGPLTWISLPRSLGPIADLAADGRPGGSHVYALGATSPDLVEIDRLGNSQVVATLPVSSGTAMHGLEVAPDGSLLIASNQGVWRHDPATGTSTLVIAGAASSLVLDAQGELWANVDGTVAKIDVERRGTDVRVPNTTAAMRCDESSPYRLARIVAPDADFDADGFTNRAEIDAGTNPVDPSSTPRFDASTDRVRALASDVVEVRTRGDLGWGFVVFGAGKRTSPLTLPGILGTLVVDQLFGATLPIPVPGSTRFRVPAVASTVTTWAQICRLPLAAGAPALGELLAIRAEIGGQSIVRETFARDAQLDVDKSSGTWGGGDARPGRLGGVGRLGSFDPALGREVAPSVFEFDTVGHTFPPEVTLFGRIETVTDGVFEFTDFVVPTGVTVRFVGDRPAVLRVRGAVAIDGTLDVGGQDVAGAFDGVSPAPPVGTPPISTPGQPGSAGGPGGGRGGLGADACDGLGHAGGRFSGDRGEDLSAPLRSGYVGTVGGSGGHGGPLWPASGLRSDVVLGLFSVVSGMTASGGGGGGHIGAGGAGTALRTFTGLPSDLSAATSGGSSLRFLLPPPGVTSIEHFLVGGSGGGGGGSHPLMMTAQQVFGAAGVSGPNAWRAGAGGAGGGGALAIRAGRRVTIGSLGRVDARGGSAAEHTSSVLGPPAPGGGGSGGSILLQVDGAFTQGGTLDLSGGTGGRDLVTAFNGLQAESVGGDGAPGFVRLERTASSTTADLGTVLGPVLGASNVGTLTDADTWTGQVSRFYPASAGVPAAWQHYRLDAEIDGVTVTYSDDPRAFAPATGPGLPVQIWFQGATLDAQGRVLVPPGPWRAFVQDLDLDRANTFRFMVLYDRSVSQDVALENLTVTRRD
jgi:hypothetical protein